jgi:L-fucose mutarotase
MLIEIHPGISLDLLITLAEMGHGDELVLADFYERAKQAFAVVMTGETAKYGNIILKKGVTPTS